MVVGDALRAQRGPHDMVSKIFSRLRRTRHEVEYPDVDYEPVSSDEAEEALEDARYIVAQMKKFIPQLGACRVGALCIKPDPDIDEELCIRRVIVHFVVGY